MNQTPKIENNDSMLKIEFKNDFLQQILKAYRDHEELILYPDQVWEFITCYINFNLNKSSICEITNQIWDNRAYLYCKSITLMGPISKWSDLMDKMTQLTHTIPQDVFESLVSVIDMFVKTRCTKVWCPELELFWCGNLNWLLELLSVYRCSIKHF